MTASVQVLPRHRTAMLAAGLMVIASVLSIVLRHGEKISDTRSETLESIVPQQFGEWRALPLGRMQVINPQSTELLSRLYSEILTRVYENKAGYRMMLSLAYGSDQRGSLQAHKPEICYPAQGFVVKSNESGVLGTPYGEIPVRRLFASLGARHEPLTYWFTVGDKAVEGYWQRRLLQLSVSLTGQIPDGMLFRVSSIDSDRSRAFRLQEQFVNDLLRSVTPEGRKRLSGLGDA